MPGHSHAPPPPRRPASTNLARMVSSSNTFVFMQLRTLSRNGATSTPLPSITCALFSMQRRGWARLGFHESPVTGQESLSPLECALTKRASCKSFRMRTCRKRWGEGRWAVGAPNFEFRFSSFVPRPVTPIVLLHAHSRGATIAPLLRPRIRASTGKQSRVPRCLREGERTAGGRSSQGCRETGDSFSPNLVGVVAGRKGRQCPIGLVP